MARIVVDVSMSLDGFITGPNVRADEPMGDGGEELHSWHEGTGPGGEVDRAVAGESGATIGATIVGRRSFDLGLTNWGGTPWPGVPCFVATHRPHDGFVGDNGGSFVFSDLEEATAAAREAAGDKDVYVLGGAVTQQLLGAGQVDLLRLHVVGVLLGSGTRLFDGQQAELIPDGEILAGSVAHLRYRVGHS